MNDIHWKPQRIWLGQWDPSYDIDCLTSPESKPNCSPTPTVVVSEIASITVHPNYPSDLYHDVALIRLRKQVKYTNYIRPICLPFSDIINTPNLTDTVAEFVSWGSESRTAGIAASAKVKIPLRIWNTDVCRRRYRLMNRYINQKYELCAGGEQDMDTCNGDSGGALMYSRGSDNEKVYFIIGVMVGGTQPCGLQGWPSISIDVESHLQWILYQMTE